MAIVYSPTLRHNRGAAIGTTLGNGAKVKLYDVNDVLLVTCVCASPAGTDTAGVFTFDTIAAGVAVGAGDATKATITTAADAVEISGLVVSDSGGSGDIKLQQTGTAISIGDTVTITSLVITQGNA